MAFNSDNLLDLLEISLGKEIMSCMNDPAIIEIMKNDDGSVFKDHITEGLSYLCHLDAQQSLNVVTLVASHINQEVTVKTPIVSAELPSSGFRFEGNIPPISVTATFNIRKHTTLDLTLDDYVKANIMTEEQAQTIKEAVKNKKNILVVGGTGSGKTTLCNAILNEMALYNERIIIIQDTNELKCKCENKVYLRSSNYVSIRDLLFSTLRRTPNRIIIGEVRDGAALNVIKAWNTGHSGGLCTLHADSAELALMQLESYISEVSEKPQEMTIVNTIDYIIDIQRVGAKRKIQGIVEVKGYRGSNGEIYYKGDKNTSKYIVENIK